MYNKPSPDAIKEFMGRHTLTGSELGKLCGVNSRTVRRWIAPESIQGHWDMPGAAWALVRILCGDATPQEIIEELNSE